MTDSILSSLKKNRKGIVLMCISSLCVCIGQLFWKLAVNYGIVLIIAGFVLYGIGALSMFTSYRFGKLSVLQPILALNYVIAVILAVTILNETIYLTKAIGILGVILGVVLIAGGDDDSA